MNLSRNSASSVSVADSTFKAFQCGSRGCWAMSTSPGSPRPKSRRTLCPAKVAPLPNGMVRS